MANIKSTETRVFDFTPFEYFLLFVATLQVAIAAFFLFSGVSLRNFLFGIDTDVGARKVAILSDSSGVVRQKKKRSPEFKGVEKSAPLFNEDTIMTGPISSAKIVLEDGGTIDLASDTMVKLSFASDYLLGLQVSRTPKIEVVTGKVETLATQSSIIVKSKGEEVIATKGVKKETKAVIAKTMPTKVILPQVDVALLHPVAKAGAARATIPAVDTTIKPVATPQPVVKPSALSVLKNPRNPLILAQTRPTPMPSALNSPTILSTGEVNFRIIEPIANASFNPQLENGSPIARTILRAKVSPYIGKAQVAIKPPRGLEKIENIEFDRNGDGALNIALNQPGKWTFTIRNPNSANTKTKSVQINVKPDIYGLTLDDLTVAGEAALSNRYSGKKAGEFAAKFSWSRVDGAKDYSLQIINGQSKVLYSKLVSEPEHEIKDVTAIAGQLGERNISYRVQANLKSGFVANSQPKPIRYQFFPPVLTAPAAGANHTMESLKPDEGRILFSWQKTNFTDEYQIELSKDSEFSSFFVQKRLTDNFLILKFNEPGEFYWRVRAYTDGKPGLTSASQKLIISE